MGELLEFLGVALIGVFAGFCLVCFVELGKYTSKFISRKTKKPDKVNKGGLFMDKPRMIITTINHGRLTEYQVNECEIMNIHLN